MNERDERRAWVIPIFVGCALTVAAVLLADALGWSDGVGGTLALLGIVVSVLLRFAMVERAGGFPRER